MREDYLISIIVPVYNAEKYIGKCINSLVNQSYSKIEILVVNDGSTDMSIRIVDKYKQTDTRIQIINQINQGVSEARNKGLSLAKGDFIIFVDSDDWLNLETCSRAIEIFNREKVDVVFWGYIKEFNNQSEQKLLFEKDILFDLKTDNILLRRTLGLIKKELSNPEDADSIVTVWGKMYRHEVIKESYFVDLKKIGTLEDALFNLEAFNNSESAYYLNDTLNHYNKLNEGSITHGYREDLNDQWNVLHEKMYSFIRINGLGKECEEALNNRISLSIIGLGLNIIGSNSGVFSKKKELKSILVSSKFDVAYASFDLSYFPVHWRIFFWAAKNKHSWMLLLMLIGIKNILKSK